MKQLSLLILMSLGFLILGCKKEGCPSNFICDGDDLICPEGYGILEGECLLLEPSQMRFEILDCPCAFEGIITWRDSSRYVDPSDPDFFVNRSYSFGGQQQRLESSPLNFSLKGITKANGLDSIYSLDWLDFPGDLSDIYQTSPRFLSVPCGDTLAFFSGFEGRMTSMNRIEGNIYLFDRGFNMRRQMKDQAIYTCSLVMRR